MTTEYEISGATRDELIYTKDQLIVDTPIVRHWDTKVEVAPDGSTSKKIRGGGRVRDARFPEEFLP